MKTIHVSNETWRSLQELKLGKGYKTLDDVISYLLQTIEKRRKNDGR